MNQPTIHILYRRNEKTGNWIAECVDFDLVAQAKTRKDLPKAFGHVLFGTQILAMERGEKPEFKPAPKHITDRWETAQSASGRKVELIPPSEFVPEWFMSAYSKVKSFAQPRELAVAGE